MKKMISRLMAMRLVAVSLAASAQSSDNMKADSMQHDDMKQAQISPVPWPIDGEATEPTRGQAHLTVSELDRAIAIRTFWVYQWRVCSLSARSPFSGLAFPAGTMLGLWEPGTMPMSISLHVAFQVALSDLHEAPSRLQKAGIQPRE